MTNEAYHAHSAISRSTLMIFSQSPYKYWAHYLNPNRPKKESTKAMDFGSAFHTFILEADKFNDEYVIEQEYENLPRVGLLRNLGRPEYEKQKAERSKVEFINASLKEEFNSLAEGKTILSFGDFDQLVYMKIALQNNDEAWALIQEASYEQSYFWRDKESELMVKARPDILHNNIIVDLKTCVNAASKAYQRTMLESGYHIQGAMIREGVRELTGKDIPNVINICIEKIYPFCIGIKIISEEALDEGRRKFKEILMNMKSAIDTNNYPDYEAETITLPSWY